MAVTEVREVGHSAQEQRALERLALLGKATTEDWGLVLRHIMEMVVAEVHLPLEPPVAVQEVVMEDLERLQQLFLPH
jgi:hypothetical protein